jgi:hypothetical protein
MWRFDRLHRIRHNMNQVLPPIQARSAAKIDSDVHWKESRLHSYSMPYEVGKIRKGQLSSANEATSLPDTPPRELIHSRLYARDGYSIKLRMQRKFNRRESERSRIRQDGYESPWPQAPSPPPTIIDKPSPRLDKNLYNIEILPVTPQRRYDIVQRRQEGSASQLSSDPREVR